ncbi:MAG: HAD family phosphatase [Bacteroidota bacterium]|nr:HAD family phosphatase [Bacteroidota bacterium]MDP4212513.1 HAD family phosphatase [Bacteroidota bacterium]MDP4248922.1 HAD family phosphatase [Bacteroidota bacterium]
MDKIKNIIFDLGGVIMDIDVRKTQKAFTEMGVKNINDYFGHGFAASFFKDHEAGKISDAAFIQKIKEEIRLDVSDELVTEAWNALLLHFPPERIALLDEIKKKYRIFLFSNTNAIHHKRFMQIYRGAFPGRGLDDHFEKAYYSHTLGHRKPDKTGFEIIVRENQLDPAETLFVDDGYINVEGAIRAGLQGLYLPPAMSINDIHW